MGKLFIPGERNIDGPWFIGNKELEELDEIFEFAHQKINESLETAKQEQAKNDVENGMFGTIEEALNRKKLLDSEYKKKVELVSKNGKILIDESIKGILKDSKLIDFKPKELFLEIGHGWEKYFFLKISKRYNGEFVYKVQFHDQDISEEIIYKIENWIEKYQPKKLNSLWSSYGSGFSFICFILSIVLFSFITYKELPDFKGQYKTEINKIIEKGVNEENKNKAVELMLKYSTDYRPENVKEITKINTTAIRFFSISIIICIIGLIKPITVIGIGTHKSLLNRYKIYTKFVLITIPALFLIPPVIEWIQGLVGL